MFVPCKSSENRLVWIGSYECKLTSTIIKVVNTRHTLMGHSVMKVSWWKFYNISRDLLREYTMALPPFFSIRAQTECRADIYSRDASALLEL